MISSNLLEGTFESDSIRARATYHVLCHPEPDETKGLPLIVQLHGAMSSSALLERLKPAYDTAWTAGTLPPAMVACVSTPTLGGFYIDHPNGSAWERLVGTEFPAVLGTRFPLSRDLALVGFSMGGYGALKLAFRAPDRYRAVAALCPTIFPAEASDDVPEKNRPSILNDLNRALGESPEEYSRNCVQSILRKCQAEVAASGIRIFLECGEHDEFRLHDGAEHLHTLMSSLGIDHVWRSVAGLGHADGMLVRLEQALRFVGQALTQHRRVSIV